MGRKKRFCNKHGLSHFPPTGKKCPGPEFSEISLSCEIKDVTGQQGGIDVEVGLLQGSIPSIPKKQLATDRLAPAVEATLSERVMAVEEALEENSEQLDQILGLLKEEKEINLPCVKSSKKPERASRTKKKTKKRTPSPSPSSSSDESTCSTSPEKEKKKKDPAKRYARKKFLEGDDKVKTGDDLLLVGVKTVEKIIEEGGNPLPCVKHLRMLTEKSSEKCLRSRQSL